jgi:hypothetical protein
MACAPGHGGRDLFDYLIEKRIAQIHKLGTCLIGKVDRLFGTFARMPIGCAGVHQRCSI